MSRARSSAFTLWSLRLTLLLVIGLASSGRALAQAGEGLEGLLVNPAQINFGNVTVGTTSLPQTDVITSEYPEDTVTFLFSVVTPGFVETGDTCDTVLGPLDSCQVYLACQAIKTGSIFGAFVFLYFPRDTAGTTDIYDLRLKIVPLNCTGVPAATPTATATATATTTVTATPTPTATSTPGPQAGSILIAGGDEGAVLGGVINLAQGTVSSAAAQIFNTATNTLLQVGDLNTAREFATAVPLPNGLTLVVGGSHCFAMTYGPGGACGVSSFNGFECDALNTAELYNESTSSFTLAGSGSSNMMTAERSGATATLVTGSGTSLDGKVLIVAGATGSSFLSLATPPPGCVPSGQVAQNTAEIYDPVADSFTATGSIPECAAGTSCSAGLPSICAGLGSAIASTSESGTTVTVTMSTANPTGLILGANVTISNVSISGYDGNFSVASVPNDKQFTYTDPTSGLTAGSGGMAAADTVGCGLVGHSAALVPNDGGKVLITGGDLVYPLAEYPTPGESSNLSFIFDPALQTFSRTGSMAAARELFPLVAMDPAVVTGPLAGDVVAFGGIEQNSFACSGMASTYVATTLDTAEVFNPAIQTWGPTANTMGVKRAVEPATLFETGSLAGLSIVPGGVDLEVGTLPATCDFITDETLTAQSETDLYEPSVGMTGTFSPTEGMLDEARYGEALGVIGAGSDANDALAVGGACTNLPSSNLESFVIGSASAGTDCSSPLAIINIYSELFSQASQTWAEGPTFAPGVSPTNIPAYAVLP
jgi:hypothetical protein